MKICSAWLMTALVAAGCLSLGLPHTAWAQPTLTHLTPGAITPGKTTQITLHGTRLNGPLRAWTSFPAHLELTAADAKQKDRTQATCAVTLSSGVPTGIGGIAVATKDGLSEVIYLMIDDLPSIADSGNNHVPTAPQVVSLPLAIDGLCDGTLHDYYGFAAQAGQAISCEVVASRLGWDFDPLVRVLDAAGNELLLADDDPSSGADPRFVFTAPATGQYVLEVRDNRYKPGGRYRLRLGDFPLASTTMPLVIQRGSPTEVRFLGQRVGATLPGLFTALGGAGLPVSVSAKSADGSAAAWARLGITDLPVCCEMASDASGAAQPIELPSLANGMFERAGDRDQYEFSASKGTLLRFRAITRSLGSAAIVSLRVQDAAGKPLAESPVTDSDEPLLSFTAPADGTYRLAVEELASRGGPDYGYAIECRRGPQFSLLLKNDKNNRLRYALPSGGAFYLDVQCQRAGYDGPIALGIESDQAGWQVFNNVLAAKANEVRMYVQPPLDLAAGEPAALRVVGRAETAGQALAASMATTVPLRLARPQLPYPPAWHDGTIFVSSVGPKPGFCTVGSSVSAIPFDAAEGKAQFTIDLERTDAKFKDTPLAVVPVGLPAGVTAEVKRNGNGAKETYDILLKGPKNLAAGEHTFRYFAYAELGGQGRGFLSGDIRLSAPAKEAQPAASEAKTP